MQMIEKVLEYAQKGWPVFPCRPNGKMPACEHGVNDATTDRNKLLEWWSRCPNYNIGLATGKPSGLYVVDIDRHGESDGYVSLGVASITLPDTLTARTPSGGEHRFYKWTDGDEPQQGSNINGLTGVDTRTTGGYVVVAPSVIDGTRYEWVDEMAWPAEFPATMKKRKGVMNVSMPWATQTVMQASIKPWVKEAEGKMTAYERAVRYVAECDPSISGSGGHNALIIAVNKVLVGFNLTDEETFNIIKTEFNPRCQPEWSDKEIWHKIRDVRSKPNGSFGWLLEEDVLGDAERARLAEIGRRVASGAIKKCEIVDVVPIENVVRKDVWTDELLYPEGFIGKTVKWIVDTANRYQPVYALGATIALAGTMLGRRVKSEYGNMTNIYCMVVGPSSSGKDHPTRCVRDVLTKAGAVGHLAADASCDTAIEEELQLGGVKIFCMGEAGHKMGQLAHAGADNCNTTIIPTFMKLFSTADSVYICKKKVGKESAKIINPCACMLGDTTPKKVFGSLSRANIEDGWLPRCLFFISKTIPESELKKKTPPPQHIIDIVHHWCFLFAEQGYLTQATGIVDDRDRIITFSVSESAVQKIKDFSVFCDSKMRDAAKEGNEADLIFGKTNELMMRLALIQAACRDMNNRTIEEKDVKWAIGVMTAVAESMREDIEANISDSEVEANSKAIMRAIEEGFKDGIKRRDLWRKVGMGLTRKQKTDYIQMLEDSGSIIICKVGQGEVYYSTKYKRLVETGD